MISANRIEWIDAAKGVAIIAVIAGHSLSFGNPIHSMAYSFHIPLFFFLAGITYKPSNIKMMISKSFSRLLIPYFLLCIFILLGTLAQQGLTPTVLFPWFLSVLFAAGGTAYPWGVAGIGIGWFLVALFFARIIVNVSYNNLYLKYGSLPYVAFTFFLMLSAYCLSRFAMLPFCLEQAAFASFFMTCGILFRQNQDRLSPIVNNSKQFLLLVLPLFVIWIGGALWGNVFFSIGNLFFVKGIISGLAVTLSAILFICLLLQRLYHNVSSNNYFSLVRIGRDSMCILMLHQIELCFINWEALSNGKGVLGAICVVVLHILLVLTSYYLVRLTISRMTNRV